MLGGDDGRMRAALVGRGAGNDALHPGHLGGDDRHVRGGHHRIAPAGHVAANRVYRDVLMAEYHAGQRLDFDIDHALALLLREIAHLGLGKLDVLEVALRHLADGALNVLFAQLEVGWRPIVELLRQLANGFVLARLDLAEDAFHCLAHLGVGGFDRARVHSALEIAGHGLSSIHSTVVPAKAGTQCSLSSILSHTPGLLDARFRGHDAGVCGTRSRIAPSARPG